MKEALYWLGRSGCALFHSYSELYRMVAFRLCLALSDSVFIEQQCASFWVQILRLNDSTILFFASKQQPSVQHKLRCRLINNYLPKQKIITYELIKLNQEHVGKSKPYQKENRPINLSNTPEQWMVQLPLLDHTKQETSKYPPSSDHPVHAWLMDKQVTDSQLWTLLLDMVQTHWSFKPSKPKMPWHFEPALCFDTPGLHKAPYLMSYLVTCSDSVYLLSVLAFSKVPLNSAAALTLS
jgi:hypothetical protein